MDIQKCWSSCSRSRHNPSYELVVGALSCHQHSINISYSVPANGTTVWITVEDKDNNILNHSKLSNAESFTTFTFTGIPAYVTLRNFKGYYMQCSVNTSKCNFSKNIESFSSVTTSKLNIMLSRTSNITRVTMPNIIQWWHIYLILSPFCFAIVIGVLWLLLKYPSILNLKLKSGKTCMFYKKHSIEVKNKQQCKLDYNVPIQTEMLPNKALKPSTVFLVFINENKNHRNVVLSFVNFLQADLGFNVICELFANVEISVDPFAWMEKSLEEADKVIVIWSPSATERWNNNSSKNTVRHDLFTPILKQIRNDLFRDVDVGKYYFAYFDYCSKENIPKIFSEPKVFHFRLMHQFDELYFRLKGIEKYIPGGVVKQEKVMFDCYADLQLNKFGNVLQESINKMNLYVKNNPNWYLIEDVEIDLPDFLKSANKEVEVEECKLNFLTLDPIDKKHFKSNELSMIQSGNISKLDVSVSKANHYYNSNSDFGKCYNMKSRFEKHQMTSGVVMAISSQSSCHNPNLFPVASFSQSNNDIDFLPIHSSAQCQEVEVLSPNFSFQKQPAFTDQSPQSLANQFFCETELPLYDHCNVSSIDTDSIAAPSISPNIPVQLAPIDAKSDPMNSLMLINNLLEKKT